MDRWTAKEGIGCLFWIFAIIWILTQCSSGGGEKTDGLNTYTTSITFLSPDIDTFTRGQEVLSTGDVVLFSLFMNSGKVIKLEEGTNVYIHDISPLKGYTKISVTSGIYKGEVGYVPSIVLKK